jgi:hypothetical protein
MLRLFSTIATAPFLRGSVLVLVLAANTAAGESPDGLWVDIGAAQRPAAQVIGPRAFRTFALREDRLEEILSGTPMEFTAAQAVSMTLPAPDGTYVRISVENSPIFSPELEAAYAGIRTYRAAGRGDRTASGRFDVGPAGFHAMLISEAGTMLVEPARDGDPSHYISYWKRDVEGKPFACSLPGASEAEHLETVPLRMTNPSGDQLRSYRLAISATGEYTAHFGSVAAAVAQIATTVNRVAAVYEREVAISFVLVATNVYPDAATDPFTAQNLGLMLRENQTALDVNVGSANYDIGHVFGGLDLGGVAFLGVVCTPGAKARGVSSLRFPSGVEFDLDLVPHEIGHQFDAGHTFHGISGFCQANRNAATAYEPGSGSTIMSYAGSCDPEDVQYVADDYFHTASFDQITNFRDTGGACGALTPTGNVPPTVDAGPDCTIPTGTPFTLVASGADANGDALTYAWEQFDLSPPWQTLQRGPLFRSRRPTAIPSRTFPPSSVLGGPSFPWDTPPPVERELNFRVTARDNRADGGGVDYDSMKVSVAGDPFAVVSPGLNDVLECGAPAPVTWDVGGGSVSPDVRISFSRFDGSFFETLLASTPNDGFEWVTLPTALSFSASIRLDASTGCFFAVSQTLVIPRFGILGFEVTDTTPPEVSTALLRVGKRGRDKRRFRVEVSCVDVCDEDPGPAAAELNGIPVANGQVVELRFRHKFAFEQDDGVLVIEAESFTLTASCADFRGNQAVGSMTLQRRDDDDDDDDDGRVTP